MSLTLHLQKIPSWFGEFVGRCEGNLGYIVGVDVFPNVPGVKTLGRTYLPDGESGTLVDRGSAGADEWINRFSSVYLDNPHVDKWIGPNEYVLWDLAAAGAFNAFHVRFIERMSALGFGVVCGQINTGWPRLRLFGDPSPYPEALAPTLDALYRHGGLFSLHEYGPGDMREGTGAHCLRYRNTRVELLAAGITNLPDFIITETGIDVPNPAAPQGHQGWRDFTDWAGYFDQLKWYSAELDKDDYMLGASIFTVADDWVTFQINQAEAMPLADYIGSDDPPPPPPDRARGIDVSQYQHDINWQAVADDGIEFAFIRATVGLRTDPFFAQNWQGAGDAGLLRGVYHYLEHDSTGQAKHFVKTVQAQGDPELGYWGDLEQAGLTASKCGAFLEATDRNIIEQIGIGWISTCNVYTRKSFFDKFGTPDWVQGRLLWVADWTGYLEPALPNAWDEWEFRQTTNDGAVPGIEGRVDLNVYNGTSEQLHETYREGEGEQDMDIKVFGYIDGEDGPQEEKSWDWLMQEFGPLDIRLAEPFKQDDGTMQVVRLIEVREQYGPANCNVELFHIDGAPVKNVNAAWHYSTAPPLPATSPPTSLWEPNADYGPTNVEGVIGFSLSEKSYYQPDLGEIGPYACWFLAITHPSDFIRGLGMDWATNHRHLNLKFQIVITDDNGPVDPEPEGELAKQIARCADALEYIAYNTPALAR